MFQPPLTSHQEQARLCNEAMFKNFADALALLSAEICRKSFESDANFSQLRREIWEDLHRAEKGMLQLEKIVNAESEEAPPPRPPPVALACPRPHAKPCSPRTSGQHRLAPAASPARSVAAQLSGRQETPPGGPVDFALRPQGSRSGPLVEASPSGVGGSTETLTSQGLSLEPKWLRKK